MVAVRLITYEVLDTPSLQAPLDVKSYHVPDEVFGKLPCIRHRLSDGWVAKFLQIKLKLLFKKKIFKLS